ncbi:MAG: PEP-CTERM sorting domain-containing protein [Acidobacteria bacterium]|nr:PEP-CTERM sorting domain-containing protein [Acidobacteriota bacterium]
MFSLGTRFACLALSFGLLFGATARAAPVTVAITATGQITTGTDDGSLSGAAGDLADSIVTLVHTLAFDSVADVFPGDPAFVVAPLVSVSIQVDAAPAVVFDTASPSSGVAIYSVGTLGGSGPALVDSQATVVTADLRTLLSQVAVQSTVDDFVGAADPLLGFAVLPPPVFAGSAGFGATLLADDSTTVLWNFLVEGLDVSSIAVVVRTLAEVPEPGTLAVLALGLLALAAVRLLHAARR